MKPVKTAIMGGRAHFSPHVGMTHFGPFKKLFVILSLFCLFLTSEVTLLNKSWSSFAVKVTN